MNRPHVYQILFAALKAPGLIRLCTLQRSGKVCLTMKTLAKKILSLILSFAVIAMSSVCVAAENPNESEILNVSISDDTKLLTVETTKDVIELRIDETIDNYVFRQYTNGELVDEVFLNKDYMVNQTTPQSRATSFFGTVRYEADWWQMQYLYTISTDVYRNVTTSSPVVYTPPNNALTMAQLAANIAGGLSIPIGFLNAAIGAIIAGASFITGNLVSWAQSKTPHLVCTKYSYALTFYHYGTAPVYEQGESISRQGTKYVVINTNEQSEYAGETFYEGLVVETKNTQTADNIYHSLYSYSPYDIIGWY